MENEDILDQKTIIEKDRVKRARERINRLDQGHTYNTPVTVEGTEDRFEDIDSKVREDANRVINEANNPSPETSNADQQIQANQQLLDKFPDRQNLSGVDKAISQMSDQFSEFHTDMKLDINPAKWAYMAGMGALDVPFDVVGLVAPELDDTFDEVTKFENEGARKFRAAASVILPTIVTAGAYGKWVSAQKLPALAKAAANVGGVGLINGAIASATDFGADPENRFLTSPQNFKRLQEWWPEIFGPQGRYPIAEDLTKIDGIDPELNRLLVGLDETALSLVGDIIGYGFNAAKPLLWKFKPLDKKAAAFKRGTQIKYMEGDTKRAISDIDGVLESGTLGQEQSQKLLAKKVQLMDQITKTGSSEVTGNPAESIIRDKQRSRQAYRDQRALKKLQEESIKDTKATQAVSMLKGMSEEEMMKLPKDVLLKEVRNLGLNASDEQLAKLGLDRDYFKPKGFDSDITPTLASETQLTGKAHVPGAAVRNTLDVTAQEMGEYSRNAVPTAPYTEAMKEKGLILGKSHHLVADIANKVRESGKYADFQDKWRSGVRSQAAWNIYEKIMKPGTGEQLGQVLSDPKYLRKETLLNEVLGDAEVQYLNPQATEAAAVAISDLLDVYLGRETQETSARVMSTLGKEISAISNASVTFKGLMDDETVFKNIMDRVELLEAEYGKSKYVAGWTLQNLKWWKRWKKGNVAETAQMTFEEFTNNATKVHSDFKVFRENLEKAKAENPRIAQILKEAYDYSDGNVNDILSLDKWAANAISPGGLIVSSGERGMNLFAKGAWAVVYNNVLSGLSGARAAVGNGSMLILKPLTTISRAGIRSVLTRDTEPIERALYMHGAMFETTRRAFSDMTARMAKVHSDPDYLMKAIRKDFAVEEDSAWSIIDNYSKEWEKQAAEGNWLAHQKLYAYRWAHTNRAISRMKWMRTGLTAMAGVDAFTDTFMATYISRIRAYDQVLTDGGKTLDPEIFAARLKKAEELNYSKMFDSNGLLTDTAAKNASGEIALNLDDGISNWLNKGLTKVPALKTLMMFPRTGINMVKQAASFLPMSLVPLWNSKYTKILEAGDDINLIKQALAEHQIDFDSTPNAMAIYKQLKDEYEGRWVIGSATAIMGYSYAMAGGIRGNGPANHSERQKLMAKGWRPYTVKIGNNWISYKGIPMVEQMFALVGDLAYYQTALGSNLVTENLDKLGWTISATFLNNTPLYGIEPFMAIINGDEAAFKRLGANLIRGAIPQSGAVGVISKAITSAQKDIYDNFWGYVLNTTPARGILPSQINHWTGEEINEMDNHLLRSINAFLPNKITDVEEPWELWLMNSGFDDIGFLTTKYDSDVKYTAEERELIGKFIGEEQLWKVINSKKFMHNKKFNEELDVLRTLINKHGEWSDEVKKHKDKMQVYRELNKLLNDAKKKAEARIALDPRFQHLDIQAKQSKMTGKLMKKDINKAIKNAKRNQEINELIVPNR